MKDGPSRIHLAWPAMKASAAFAAGVLLGAGIPVGPAPVALTLGLSIFLLFHWRNRGASGDFLALTVLILSGMFAFCAQNSLQRSLEIPFELMRKEIRVEGMVAGDVRLRRGNTFFTLNCRSISTDSVSCRISGLLPCVLYDRTVLLSEGTRVSLGGRPGFIHHALESSSFSLVPGRTNFTTRLSVFPSDSGFMVLERGYSPFGRIRDAISSLAYRYNFGNRNDLLLAMTIGDVRTVSPDTRAAFTRSGIAHLLAVSGMNLGVLAVVVHFLLGLFSIEKKVRILSTLVILTIYAGICGFQPPITRALLMAVILSGSLVFERTKNTENALFAALLIILAADPGALCGASLQLSFAAVWILTAFQQPVMRRLEGRYLNIWPVRMSLEVAAATLLASFITAPIAAAHFGLLPLTSLPVNVPAVPLASAITVTGMAAIGLIALGPFFAVPAQVMVLFVGFMIRLLSALADYASQIPFASIDTGGIHPLYVAAFAAWLFILSRARGRPVFRKLLLYIPLIVLVMWTWNPVARAALEKDSCSAVFFDVGQGDASLVRCGCCAFLVDTGPPWGERTAAESILVPSLRNIGVERLDAVFLSHLDADHAAGLETLVRKIRIDRIFCRESVADSMRTLYGKRVTSLCGGDSVAFEGGGIKVIFPSKKYPGGLTENSRSLIFRLDAGGNGILYTGDIDSYGQRKALLLNGRLASAILKVPHHGASGLDREFLEAISPRVAVISCGLNNRYGHPSSSTLSILELCGCTILRTDSMGAVAVDLRTLEAKVER